MAGGIPTVAPFRNVPPQSVLRELLDYDPETGVLRWRHRPLSMFTCEGQQRRWNTRHAGQEALAFLNGGYKIGCLFHQQHRAHRVIWKWMTGDDPEIIDHLSGDRTDNRWENLRSTDVRGNSRNRAISRNNSSGCSGVTYHRRDKRWVARIRNNDKREVELGSYHTFEAAVSARKLAERELGYHLNHGRTA